MPNKATPSFDGVQAPTNVATLLQNMKFTIDRRFLLQKDFYTEPTLERFFGARQVIWGKHDVGMKWGHLAKLDGVVAPVVMDGMLRSGIDASFTFDLDHGGKASATWLLGIAASPSIDFAGATRIFGRNWKQVPWSPPSPHGQYRPPTREHGNEQILYSDMSDDASYQLTLEFYPDATLNMLRFSAEGTPRQ